MTRYNSHLIDIMYQFSPHMSQPLREIEVFTGTILGKNGSMPTRSQREEARNMKSEFDAHVRYTIKCITDGIAPSSQVEDLETEALARSIACLSVAMEEAESVPRIGKLESFCYVVAAACMMEIEKYFLA